MPRQGHECTMAMASLEHVACSKGAWSGQNARKGAGAAGTCGDLCPTTTQRLKPRLVALRRGYNVSAARRATAPMRPRARCTLVISEHRASAGCMTRLCPPQPRLRKPDRLMKVGRDALAPTQPSNQAAGKARHMSPAQWPSAIEDQLRGPHSALAREVRAGRGQQSGNGGRVARSEELRRGATVVVRRVGGLLGGRLSGLLGGVVDAR